MTRPDERSWLRLSIWPGAGLLWLVALAADRFSAAINWGFEDFLALAILLLAANAAFEIIASMTTDWRYRLLAALSILLGFIGVWLELAVGVFGPG